MAFHPVDFFIAVDAMRATTLRAFDTLTIDTSHARGRFAVGLSSYPFAEQTQHLAPSTSLAPFAKVRIDQIPLSKIMRQIAPLNASAIHIENCIDNLPDVHFTGAAPLGFGKKLCHQFPLGVRKIARISFSHN